ncbi:MAG: T9SS type A sorting domain-containing protein [Ignavibacteriae bacterium]|nr:T9SS type A sorting domain-containing protein [Ignavibacteriota bacterium]
MAHWFNNQVTRLAMSFKIFFTQLIISFMFLLGSVSMGQVEFTLPLMYHDTSMIFHDTIYWGLRPGASYCATDSGEVELPPMACGISACVHFADVMPIGNGACMGQGTYLDVRPSYSSSQIDTYKVVFVSIFPITFHWLPTLYQYYDSAKITRSGVSSPAINMFTQDSLFIDNPSVSAIKIFTYGPKQPNGVGEFWNEQPMQFSLEQNYPNPFNPSTNFGFRIANFGFVTLKVFDVLGREVAKLVDEKKEAGKYSVQWNAEGLPSGVYFYKLQAGEFSSVKKLLLMR